jgi:hypothetical protein
MYKAFIDDDGPVDREFFRLHNKSKLQDKFCATDYQLRCIKSIIAGRPGIPANLFCLNERE